MRFRIGYKKNDVSLPLSHVMHDRHALSRKTALALARRRGRRRFSPADPISSLRPPTIISPDSGIDGLKGTDGDNLCKYPETLKKWTAKCLQKKNGLEKNL
jgi:hypothetical protein